MPSIRSLVPFMGLALAALLQVTSAIPTPVAAELDAECAPTSPVKAVTPTVPIDGATSSLPTTNSTLKFVALGRGIQNYTCTAANATPVAVGAIATLFDATSIANTDEDGLNALPAAAVFEPLPAAGSSITVSGQTLPVLGNHYFDSVGTPSFVLSAVNMAIFAAKIDSVTAPTDAANGPDGTAAVPWLYLTAKSGYTSVGLTEVYRVETAGGSAFAACTEAGTQSIQYSAEYWFYD